MTSDADPSARARAEAVVASYLRHRSTSRGRQCERAGPFLATFSADDPDPDFNYAIPDDDAHPSPAELASLVAAFETRQRRCRLEYLGGRAPAVETAAVAAGFVVEDRLAVMTCDQSSVAALVPPQGIELVRAISDADLVATRSVQALAFGRRSGPSPEGLRRLRANLDAGGLAVLARDTATGQPAGAGCCTVPARGVTELVGIAVAPAFRRRTIGRTLTARLAQEAFAAGLATAFLSPLDDQAAQGVYAPAGFAVTSEVVHLSR